jgi:hypothetical protein
MRANENPGICLTGIVSANCRPTGPVRAVISATWKRQRGLVLALLAGVVMITGAGCQTFSLSQEDFQKQQRGQTVDRETGDAVGVAGTVGYYGFMIGEILAAAFGK